MTARNDQLMQLLRQVDPAPAALDDAEKVAAYQRLHAVLATQPLAAPARVRPRRPLLPVLAAGLGIVAVLVVLLAVISRPRHDTQATQAPDVPTVHFTVSVNGNENRYDQAVPMVAGHTYQIAVRATIQAGAHFTAFEVIIAGEHTGISHGRPTGNFDPVVTVAHMQDSLTATGTWTARPMHEPGWIAVVYSSVDSAGSFDVSRNLLSLQIR
jgi:hypothetical protein